MNFKNYIICFLGIKTTNAWEQYKLNEVTDYKSSSLSIDSISDDGLYNLYDAQGVIGKTNSEIQKKEYITIIKDGSGVGKIRKMEKNTAFIGTMGAIVNTYSDLNFLFSILEKFNFDKYISGSTIPHIYYKDYGTEKINIPKRKEQMYIGSIFENIGNLITLHHRKYIFFNT